MYAEGLLRQRGIAVNKWIARLALLSLLVSSSFAGTLNLTLVPLSPGTAIDLSNEGQMDWAHWGLDATNLLNRKAGVVPRISDLTVLGLNHLERDEFEQTSCSWIDGTPISGVSNTTTSIFVPGFDNGFQLQVPATPILSRLRIYAGAFGAQGRFEASLSDGSTPALSDSSLVSFSGKTNAVYDIEFAANSLAQTLTLVFKVEAQYDPDYGSVAIQAATLVEVGSNQAPTVTIVSPTNNLQWGATASLPILVNAADSDGMVEKVEFFANNTKIGESVTAPFEFLWLNPDPGEQRVTAVAIDDRGETARSSAISIFVFSGQGSLSVSNAIAADAVNLSVEGRADWAHWGLISENSFNHKAGVLPQISNVQILGSEPAYNYFDNATAFSWNGGTPVGSIASTTSGIYVVGLSNGFQVRVNADTTMKTLRLYAGAYGARGRLQARLSDYSAAIYSDSSVDNVANGPSTLYEFRFKAGAAEQELIVNFTVNQMYDLSFGNVTLQAATLVSDNDPPEVSLLSPAGDNELLLGSPVTLEAAATDVDGSISRVQFYANGVLVGTSSNAPYTLALNSLALGSYEFTAKATDNEGSTGISAARLVHIIRGGGRLSASFTSPPAQKVYLTAEGQYDWAHWGLETRRSYNHKRQVTAQLGDLSSVGTSQIRQYTDNFTRFAWSDGMPTLVATNIRSGIFVYGEDKGFELIVPASTNVKVLKIYCGLYAARGKFEAALSDWSAAPYKHTGLERIAGNGYAMYRLAFASAGPNATLRVRWLADEIHDDQYGNVTWQAATLSFIPNAPVLKTLPSLSEGVFSFAVPTQSGFSYTVEFTEQAGFQPWQVLNTLSGTGSDQVVSDPIIGESLKIYRVRVE